MAKKNIDTERPVEFLNPFNEGVNYETFLAAIPKGMSVAEYCEGNLEADQIAWLESDLEHYTNSKNK